MYDSIVDDEGFLIIHDMIFPKSTVFRQSKNP